MVAFLSGILLAYAFLNLSIGHPLLRAAQGIERSGSWGPEASREVWNCPRTSTFPIAMGNATEDFTAPDKLIVAARHTEVGSYVIDACCRELPSERMCPLLH